MNKHFKSIINQLIHPKKGKKSFFIFDPLEQFDIERDDEIGIARALNAAFMIALTQGKHPHSEDAVKYLTKMTGSSFWRETAEFYLKGIDLIYEEINNYFKSDIDLKSSLEILDKYLSGGENNDPDDIIEKIWAVFFS